MIELFTQMHPVSIGAIILLVGYFLFITWIFFYRYLFLLAWVSKESESLESLLLGAKSVSSFSYLHTFLSKREASEELFTLGEISATKEATKFLSLISIVASTAPFIGLFGTVVSLLGTFSNMAQTSTGTIGVVTAGVSDALIATAVGIFVATFAYTFHQLLKRKAFNVIEMIRMQSQAILSRKEA